MSWMSVWLKIVSDAIITPPNAWHLNYGKMYIYVCYFLTANFAPVAVLGMWKILSALAFNRQLILLQFSLSSIFFLCSANNSKDLKSGAHNLMDLFDHMITFYFQIILNLPICNKSWESQFCVAVSSYYWFAVQVFCTSLRTNSQ